MDPTPHKVQYPSSMSFSTRRLVSALCVFFVSYIVYGFVTVDLPYVRLSFFEHKVQCSSSMSCSTRRLVSSESSLENKTELKLNVMFYKKTGKYYKVFKIRLNASHRISENGIYCSM